MSTSGDPAATRKRLAYYQRMGARLGAYQGSAFGGVLMLVVGALTETVLLCGFGVAFLVCGLLFWKIEFQFARTAAAFLDDESSN